MIRNKQEPDGKAAKSPRLFWTEAELAAELSVTTRTIRNLRARRIIPYVKIGAIVRYDRAGVTAALARQTVQAVDVT